jgi:hypothetical protein
VVIAAIAVVVSLVLLLVRVVVLVLVLVFILGCGGLILVLRGFGPLRGLRGRKSLRGV